MRWLLVVVAVGLLLTPDCSWGRSLPDSGEVAFVCDGDTIILKSGEKVRYLGIDAPEIAHDRGYGRLLRGGCPEIEQRSGSPPTHLPPI